MSGSLTQTVAKKKASGRFMRRERVYDYVYDPVYTVSSEVDHVRSGLKAVTSENRLRRVPQFGSMFSNLVHHPRYTLQLDPDPLPPSVDRSWRGRAERRREVLQQQQQQQLSGAIPDAQVWTSRDEQGDVTGVDRWKYFKRPLIPIAQQPLPDVIFASPKNDLNAAGGKRAKQPSRFTVGVQTDYRESETQTDPFSPEYVVRSGATTPELLYLRPLTWGHGLPAGQAEVQMIERARARRAWEAGLPPLDDLTRLDQRRRMMEEMEAREWAFREEEIQKLQENRLSLLADLLRQRDEAQTEVAKDRLTGTFSLLHQETEAKLQKIHKDHDRSVRKLDAKRRNVEGKLERRVRAPTLTLRSTDGGRDGSTSRYLDTFEGLSELEAGLCASPSPSSSRPGVKKPKPRDETKPPVTRAEELMIKYRALREEGNQPPTKTPPRFLIKTEKPVPRPLTPGVDEPPEGDEESELAVVHLQKLLRGRSLQCELFVGKENHMDLIRELRSTHALQREEQQLKEEEREFVIALQKHRDQQLQKESQERASRAGAVGAELDLLFDTLSKELIRLQEERRIHAFSLLAERERRLREARESGRRQEEERRRMEDDHIFRQVVQVHQETVDMYLEEVILASMERTADQQAREEIRRKVQEVNDLAYAQEESRTRLQSEEIVSELVYGFLIPEVEKIRVRSRVHLKQQRHLEAARSIILRTAEDYGKAPATPGRTSPSTGPSDEATDPAKEDAEQN